MADSILDNAAFTKAWEHFKKLHKQGAQPSPLAELAQSVRDQCPRGKSSSMYDSFLSEADGIMVEFNAGLSDTIIDKSACVSKWLTAVAAGQKGDFAQACLKWLWAFHRIDAQKLFLEHGYNPYGEGAGDVANLPPIYAKRRAEIASHIDRLTSELVAHPLQGHFENFLKREAGGFWLLTAGPGMGKTSIMANLALVLATKGLCVPYFFRDRTWDGGMNSRDQFYRYLSARIRAHFGSTDQRAVIEPRDDFVNLLEELSFDGKIAPDNRLIILVDALDEMSGFSFNDPNPLGLPANLPDHVFVAASVRRKSRETLAEVLPEGNYCHVRMDIEHNSADAIKAHKSAVEDYVSAKMAERTGAEEVATRLVRRVCERAGYNFLILRCVLNDDDFWRAGTFEITKVPRELEDYYDEYYARVGHMSEGIVGFDVLFGFALRQRISSEFFQVLIGGNKDEIDRMRQWIAQGLVIEETEDGVDWLSIYHETFRDFLDRRRQDAARAGTYVALANRMFPETTSAKSFIETYSNYPSAFVTEWIILSLDLIVAAKRYDRLEELLTELEFWRWSLQADNPIEVVFDALRWVAAPKRDQERVQRIFDQTSAMLREWSKLGALGDGISLNVLYDSARESSRGQRKEEDFMSLPLHFKSSFRSSRG